MNNKKGFTLIELLAVIVILAVVLVVTIPTVLSSMGSAKEQTFTNTVNSVTEWFEKEYQASLIDTADKEFTNFVKTSSLAVGTKAVPLTNEIAAAAGINKVANFDITNSKVLIKTNGRVCIKLVASTTGDFSSLSDKIRWSSSCTEADKNIIDPPAAG